MHRLTNSKDKILPYKLVNNTTTYTLNEQLNYTSNSAHNTGIGNNFGVHTKVNSILQIQTRLLKTKFKQVFPNFQTKKSLREENEELKKLAYTDGLTGLNNRTYYNENISKILEDAIEKKYPVSYLMIDIDDFKRVNDTLGHLVGDKALQNVADIMIANTIKDQTRHSEESRISDLCFRFGGDEFCIILPNTDEVHSQEVKKRINDFLSKQKIKCEKYEFSVSVSIGSKTYLPDELEDKTPQELLKEADDNLYDKKHSKKNHKKSDLKTM